MSRSYTDKQSFFGSSIQLIGLACAKSGITDGAANFFIVEAVCSRVPRMSRYYAVYMVDYSCTPEEVQQHFQSCGTVNRVTIRSNKYGQPKGYAYVEFVEPEAVQEALLLNESELHGRQLKVTAKRTNVPGMKVFRARRPSPYMGYRSRVPYMPMPFFSPYGYGKVPRFRMPMRYNPYY